jgi:unsaturated rhamnogalacturonyl hydrolase
MLRIFSQFILTTFICAAHIALASAKEPLSNSAKIIGVAVVQDLLSRENYMQYISDQYNGLHYAEAAVGYGALLFSAEIKDQELIAAVDVRYAKVPGTETLLSAEHVDANVWGILPIQQYLLLDKKHHLQFGLELADAQWAKPLANGLTPQTRFWIDDMWMIGVLQVQAYRATKNPVYLDRAALEISVYLEKLQQQNGLFFHGPEAHFYWGRGNGWVAAALAELLSELPKDHAQYSFIEKRYKIMMKSLLKYQAASGMWRQLVDYPESWEESSATAMFGFAMAVGVERKILKNLQYKNAYEKAWSALANRVNEKGQLSDICVGTGQSKDVNYYLSRPSVIGDFHGQAPLLWFAQKIISHSKIRDDLNLK